MSPKMSYLHSKNNVFCSMNLNQFSALPSPLYPCGFFPKFYGNVGVISRHLGPGGAGGARAPPRIEILLSKNFQNGQNFIFLLFGPPLRKNRSQGPDN